MFPATRLKSVHMINRLQILPISAALSAALLLSSCGKQEAVGDVPSSEELAKQADAATQALRAEIADKQPAVEADADLSDMITYENELRRFTIMVPSTWVIDKSVSDDDGRVFRDELIGLTLKAGWIENRADAVWAEAVKAVADSDGAISGAAVGDNEYRASGLADGRNIAERLLRHADGTMVRAVVEYDAAQADKVAPIAKAVLDSLTLQ